MIYEEFEKLNLPKESGVYFWLGKKIARGGKDGREILYIGKATNLRDRVRSYFSADLIKTRGAHMVDMVFKTETIAWEETSSVLEALILEANLIKKYQPYYNKQEKDDKSFNCIAITKEDFPRIVLVRERDISEANKMVVLPKSRETVSYDAVFGPYPKGSAIREALKIIRKIFPFRDTASSKKDREVFYRQIELAPDVSNTEAVAFYKKNISRIKAILQGKMQSVLKTLKKEMLDAAKHEDFELAQELKKKVFALEHVQDVSLIKRESGVYSAETFRIEGYDVAHISGKQMVGVMVVIENTNPAKSEYRKFNIKGFSNANDTGALKEILERRFTHTEWAMPDAIVVDGGIAQMNVAHAVLKELSLSIPVIAITKDERHKPKAISGPAEIITDHKYAILLANSEAHRFAVGFHRAKRDKIK